MIQQRMISLFCICSVARNHDIEYMSIVQHRWNWYIVRSRDRHTRCGLPLDNTTVSITEHELRNETLSN